METTYQEYMVYGSLRRFYKKAQFHDPYSLYYVLYDVETEDTPWNREYIIVDAGQTEEID